jgi:S-adenosylmethionine:tRNA ribosyltransferase-isomerase
MNSTSFELPQELSAAEPPESRGLSRDGVRLLYTDRHSGAVGHTSFPNIAQLLKRSDILVFNRSRTLPAAIKGIDESSGSHLEVRLAERLQDDTWLCLLMCEGDELFSCGLHEAMRITFASASGSDTTQLIGEVLSRDLRIPRLWRMRFNWKHKELLDYLYRHGRPIRYEYVSKPWSIEYYQNVYSAEPGSAEMPSAGRAFTWKLLFDLRRKGIKTTSIVLHTGLSSYMDDQLDATHPASEEEYIIDSNAADAINAARMAGGRVIAVGTTVVRALESACNDHGFLTPTHSYTQLHISAQHKLRCVDGLLTGLHEPEASHLDLLSAFISPQILRSAYLEAIDQRYLWHEFGDLNLIA